MPTLQIDSLSSYVQKLDDVKTEINLRSATLTPWYRGQSVANRNLIPSMYRCEIQPTYEREMIRDFKIKLATAAVRENKGNKTLAARSLNISRAYLHRLIRVAEGGLAGAQDLVDGSIPDDPMLTELGSA